jgi:hypothetical protein
VFAFGQGVFGALGLGDTNGRSTPHQISSLSSSGVVGIAAGGWIRHQNLAGMLLMMWDRRVSQCRLDIQRHRLHLGQREIRPTRPCSTPQRSLSTAIPFNFSIIKQFTGAVIVHRQSRHAQTGGCPEGGQKRGMRCSSHPCSVRWRQRQRQRQRKQLKAHSIPEQLLLCLCLWSGQQRRAWLR